MLKKSRIHITYLHTYILTNLIRDYDYGMLVFLSETQMNE